MKTFKRFLRERKLPTLQSLIEKDCTDFLIQSKGAGFFARGINTFRRDSIKVTLNKKEITIYRIPVRQDRKPKDSGMDVTKNFNAIAKKKFGWEPRTSGLFVYPHNVNVDNNSASSLYGEPFIAIPIGKFKYVWSPNVNDFITHESSFKDTNTAIEREMYFDRLEYTDSNLEKFLKLTKVREAMIGCANYYAIPFKHFNDLAEMFPNIEINTLK